MLYSRVLRVRELEDEWMGTKSTVDKDSRARSQHPVLAGNVSAAGLHPNAQEMQGDLHQSQEVISCLNSQQ